MLGGSFLMDGAEGNRETVAYLTAKRVKGG